MPKYPFSIIRVYRRFSADCFQITHSDSMILLALAKKMAAYRKESNEQKKPFKKNRRNFGYSAYKFICP